MEEDEQRRRKVEAGRAKLAQFRQRKAKGDSANSKKKTAKRKGTPVTTPVPEEAGAVASGAPEAGEGMCLSPSHSGSSASSVTASQEGPDGERLQDLEQLQKTREAVCPQQAEVFAKEQEQECELAAAAMQSGQVEADERPQTQPVPSLELEALRLSLSNMHTAQLELTQANLQREKETALVELRDMLNERHAQELALAQSRQQLERDQHAREREELALRCGQEAAELKEKLQSEMEKNAQVIAALQQDWASERDLCLENLRSELSAKHQSELEQLQSQFSRELAEQKAELEKIFQAKDQAESTLQTLEAQHNAAVRKLQEDLQAECSQHLRELEVRFKEKEAAKQRELEELQASYEELKAQSREEIRRLWAQLAPAGGSSQESSEVQEQFQARQFHEEELEHLKRDFVQQRQREKTEHESELEELRIYFEKKLQDAERSYREDLLLLQQRLQEVKEDSLLESGELSSSSTLLEETSGKEGREWPDKLSLQLEPPEVLDIADEGEQGLGPSEESRQGLARMCLRCAQDTTLEVEAEVAARVSGLETKHKVKLSLLRTELKEEIDLLKIENRNLHEKLQYEIHLREDLVKVKRALVGNHQQELKQAREEIQVMKQELKEKEARWAAVAEEGRRKAEEKLMLALLELREQAESEKQSIISKSELREGDMRQLQAQQAAQILNLEASLVEQQGRLRQLELASDEAVLCKQCGQETGDSLEAVNSVSELTILRLKEDCALQLMLAQNRFLEERKKITEKFSAEQDASLREAQQKHEVELRLLREQHQQHVQSLTVELESKHRLEVEELRATWESEQRALSDAHVAQLQARHAAEVGALETKHLANLDSLEACYVSAVQAVRDEHRRALELLQTELEGQLQKKEASHQLLLTQELQKLQLRHEEELRAVRHSLVEKGSAGPPESLLTTAPQGESQRTTAVCEVEEAHRLELERTRSLHQAEKLQEKASQIQQLKDQVVSLRQEVDEHHSKLETLQQRRERENQEGAALISMLRADTELAREERQALAEALKRLLGLFGEMLKTAVALRGRISERVGLCLEDEHPLLAQPGDQDPGAGLVLNELWAGSTPLEPDTMLPECSDVSSVGDISSHICESFMSPDSTLEWEPSVRRVFQSLDLAVNALLEMVLDSSRQLEEARQTHARFEREFSCKNEETTRVVLKHQELLRRLDEESAATTRLTRELHEARGVIEGFREEQASLQEVLDRKDSAERDLVAELERLRLQLRQEAQQAEALKEENAVLQGQRETAAAEARGKEEALQQQVASLSQQQLETRKQSEKDRAALLAQMKVLESELEEQLARQQACARQDSELAALHQQLDSLDKHLRSQRQFMDEQAVEREHEREEFQQEIRRLEERLRQSARPQPRGPGTSEPAPLDKEDESLQEKLREKLDELSEMTLKRELAEKQVLHQQEEMRRLEEADCASRAAVGRLQEQLEKQRHELRSLQQDKEALQEQQMNHLLLVSTLQSRLDEAKCPLPPKDPGAQLEAVQQTLLQRECEALQLTEQLEQARADLAHRDEEILRLHLQLDVQDRVSAGIRALQEENARLKTSLQNKEEEILGVNQRLEAQLAGTGAAPVEEVVPQRSSELEELRSVIETLRENQGRLQRERVEEVERLHEIIERLQGELGLEGPQAQGASAGRAGSLQSELDGATADGRLEGELQAALAAREALSQLLAERELGHRQALEALQQRLQAAEEAATHRLAHLVRLEQQEAEAQDVAARLRDCEARVVARDLQVAALSRRRLANHTQLEAILAACARLRLSLEQLPPTEPPELQHLRAQCLRLSRQLQMLGQRFKKELRVLQQGAPLPDSQADQASGDGDSEWFKGSRLLNSGPPDLGGQLQGVEEDDLPLVKGLESGDKAGLHAPDGVLSVLAVCQRQLEAELLQIRSEMHLFVNNFSKTLGYRKGKENPQKVDLITQVEQLQDKLNHLSCSLNGQDSEAKACPSLDPLELSQAQEDPLSGHSSNTEGSDTAPPEDTVGTDEASWCPLDTLGNQDSLKRCDEPQVPEEEEAVLPLAPTGGAEPLKSSLRTMDLSSWSSPEAVRKDSTLDTMSGLVLTPCSEALSQHSLDMSLRDQRGSTRLQASWTGLSCSPGGPAAGKVLWAADGVSSTDLHVQQTSVEKDVEDFIITSLDSQDKSISLPLGLEGNDDAGDSSERGEMLKPGSTSLEVPAAGPAALPVSSIRFCQSLEVMKEKELNPKQVKALLQMVCNESHQILALSEYRGLPSALSKGEPNTPECLPREGLGLMEVAPALRGPLSPATSPGEQEPTGLCLDWREEFLQLAQETFEKQREMLRAELQPQSQGGPEPGSLNSLWERLEKLACEQGGLRDKLLGPVQGPDRSSLLSEVQALRAQLRMTHLQNQEKLQQLCAALTSAEARGSRREHQLRRQVELLAYKVEQEKCIASDLQKTLSAEQDKASGAQRLLALEQGVVRDLKAELSQCRQESEQLQASLSDMQQEVHQLRSLLDCKEQDLRTALQELEAARGQEGTLEGRLQEVQLRHLEKEGQSAKALEELQSSLDWQVTQSDRLRVALKQEQTARDNLQKELRIESSRCEALLAQEQARLAELQRGLESERARTQELSAALQHERLLTEQLSLRVREACTHREGQAQRTLLRKLRDEQARVRELQVSLEQAQQLALCTQQQLEVEVQARCEELRREKERELELQRQRDAHKVKQLQRAVQELEAEATAGPCLQLEQLQQQRQGLEKARQQLLCAAGLLSSFISQTLDRTLSDWTSSNEKAVASLLHTLEELKSELTTASPSLKKDPTGLPVRLMDILLKDNECLRQALGGSAREKAELSRTVSRLEKTLKHHLLKGCALSKSDRSASKQDRSALQRSTRHPEPGLLSAASSEDASSGHIRMEKLYLHYLRAESFRKALIYQKKYLLLLIGGFQDSEQETLSMIAHLGVFPSKADRKASTSRPFTRFRTAVRVVVAIFRLRFLVKKWQEVDRKGALGRPVFLVPRQKQTLPETSESPPTREASSGRTRDTVPKTSPRRRERCSSSSHSRSESFLTASQDPECSLTEYIHHLEKIQQRLGGLPPDSTSKKHSHQKNNQ